jgi:long-subunit acyl-CoA synthetase (AMP-forming)
VAALAAVTAHRHHDRVAANWREPGNDRWRSVTWGALARRWRHGALGLEANGVGLGDVVGVAATPGVDSLAIEQAVLAAGAASVFVGEADDAIAALTKAAARACVVDATSAAPGVDTIAFDDAVRAGETIDREQPDRFEKLVERIDPGARATIDGSDPGRVVELTHEELLWSVRSFDRLVVDPRVLERDDHTVATCGLHDVLGRTLAHYWPVATGTTVWWPERLSFVDAVHEAQPTVVVAGSAAWGEMARAAVRDANDRWVVLGRLAVAGEPLSWFERAMHRGLRRLFRVRLERRMGLDRCATRLLVAPADSTVVRELAAVGVELRRAWACGAAGGLVTAGRSPARHDASVGAPMPGVSVRVGDAGIEVRRAGATSWIPTGAYGRLDARGELHLLHLQT